MRHGKQTVLNNFISLSQINIFRRKLIHEFYLIIIVWKIFLVTRSTALELHKCQFQMHL